MQVVTQMIKMKNNLFRFLLSLTLIASLSLSVVSLVSAEESVVLDASLSSKTTQKLKERIEKIVEEKKEQIKGIISNLDATKQGFIGEVQRISEEAITVKTNQATRIIPITEDVEILKDGKEIVLSDIAVENWLVIMGIIEDDTFKPLRILVSGETLRPRPSYITIGNISAIERYELTVTPRSGEEETAITLNSKTSYEDLNGEEINRTDIEEDTQALIIAFDDDGEKIAKRVRILTIIDEE
ncbi:MAG: hypothetical protein OEX81_00625 [Candidatus Pacebacteria bacterium]|nr:hypothetical protein [Candidatus Paceibacterota bacterium]